MTHHYLFELECPRCGTVTQATGARRVPPPHITCGDCFVEFKVVRVDVIKGANPT